MNAKLEGVRIWLAASVHDASEEDKTQILAFVKAFAKAVFSMRAGRLVHGSHPDIRGTLLAAAREHQRYPEDKVGLVMVVSRHFSKEPEKWGIDLKLWNDVCAEKVIETREVIPPNGDSPARDASLAFMRRVLAEQCNVLVSVGGRWWEIARENAGVVEEIDLAFEQEMPCFLLGGLGGATKAYLTANRDLLQKCNNGWTEQQNIELAGRRDVAEMASDIVQQISRLPVRHRSPHSGRPFRILCLDGGGIRGVFTAAVLTYWEKISGCRVVDQFDLIAGTSTGGLLAIGLGLGVEAEKMLAFYCGEGPKIFGAESGIQEWWHSFRHWFGTKYSSAALEEGLRKAYPAGKTLDDSACRLIIPVYNQETDRPGVCRTPHPPFTDTDAGRDPVLIALATAAAPTYFAPVELRSVASTMKAVDGGMWANCPAIPALAEAVNELKVPIERIDVLSIGTTYTTDRTSLPLLLDQKMIGSFLKGAGGLISRPLGWFASLAVKAFWKDQVIRGKIGYAPNIAGFLMKAQAQTTEHLCQGLLGDRYLRVDCASNVKELDNTKAIDQLAGLGEDEAKRFAVEVMTRFLNGVPADDWKRGANSKP